MRIGGIQAALGAYNSKNKTNKIGKNSDAALKSDNMRVSNEAKTFSAAFNAAKNSPEVREEKINSLKESIKNGQYKVDDEKLVDRLIENMQINKRLS